MNTPKQPRKYYKIIATRYPPYCPLNSPYDCVEHVYAFSRDGAISTFIKYHKNGYGHYTIKSCEEIAKSEFKGHHHFESLPMRR